MVSPEQRGGEPDYWAVLGLQPGASAAELKRAFRQQARRWHPDLNQGDPTAEERFKSINAAYGVLSNPAHRWGQQRDDSSTEGELLRGFPSFEDYLAHLLGGRQPVDRSSAPPSPSRSEPEPSPPGAPATPQPAAPAPPTQSQICGETPLQLTPQQAWEGSQQVVVLPDGTHVEVSTPPGAGDGWRLRLAGAAPGGEDHLLRLQVRTQDGLRLEGLQVHYRLDLSPADAVLGALVTVPTMEGPVELQVPPQSSSGRLLRLPGCGLCVPEGCGDQIVELRIVIPSPLPEDMVELYHQLQDLESSF